MKQNFDTGTPETAVKLTGGRTGLDYLHALKTIDDRQRVAGSFYAACFRAWHAENYPQSALGKLVISEGGYDPCGEYWGKLCRIHDYTAWKKLIDARLSTASFKARRPYIHIIQHIAGLDDWNLQDLQTYCAGNHVYGAIRRRTASRWVRKAFDSLAEILDLIVDSWERGQNAGGGVK